MKNFVFIACLIVCSLFTVTDCRAQSDKAWIGIWKSDHRQPYFLQLTTAENGKYEIPYGYERCGVWGTITAQRNGRQLSGRYQSSLDSGDIRIEFGPSQNQATLYWKDDETQKAGNYRLFKVTSSLEDGMLDSNPMDQAWRHQLIESHVREAVRSQMTMSEWTNRCNTIRREIEQARKWPKGWPLPTRMRRIGWNDWEIGWVEIDFLEAVRKCNDRDLERPVSEVHHVRYHQSEKPRAGYDAQHQTSYRKYNQAILDQFMGRTGGRTGASGIRYSRAYYAMWDYLTANESRGVIARVIRDGVEPKLGFYNDNHRTLTGEYRVQIRDGDRPVLSKSGKVSIPPYEEATVEVDPSAAYTFFAPHITLEFIPDGYPTEPIPKERLSPFHESVDEYVSISNQEDPEKDFAHAMLWARVEQAWDANDLLEYRHSVRDAGSCLYRFRGQQPEVREYVRKYLAQLEDTSVTLGSDATSGEVELNFDYDPIRGNMVSYMRREMERYDPDVFAKLNIDQADMAPLRGRLETRVETADNRNVTINARIENGRLFLDTVGYEVLLTGTVTLFDGPVNLGTYSLVAYTDKDGVPFTNSCRMTTFYQDSPTFQLDLELHCYQKRSYSDGSGPTFNLLNQLNRAGAFVQPRSID